MATQSQCDQATLRPRGALCQSKLIFNETLMVSSGLKKLFEYN